MAPRAAWALLPALMARAQDRCITTMDFQDVYNTRRQQANPPPAAGLACFSPSPPPGTLGWCIGWAAACNYAVSTSSDCPVEGGFCSSCTGSTCVLKWGCPPGVALGTVVTRQTWAAAPSALPSPSPGPAPAPTPVPIPFPITVNFCNHDGCAAPATCPVAGPAAPPGLSPGAAAGLAVGVALLVLALAAAAAVFFLGGLAAAAAALRKSAGLAPSAAPPFSSAGDTVVVVHSRECERGRQGRPSTLLTLIARTLTHSHINPHNTQT